MLLAFTLAYSSCHLYADTHAWNIRNYQIRQWYWDSGTQDYVYRYWKTSYLGYYKTSPTNVKLYSLVFLPRAEHETTPRIVRWYQLDYPVWPTSPHVHLKLVCCTKLYSISADLGWQVTRGTHLYLPRFLISAARSWRLQRRGEPDQAPNSADGASLTRSWLPGLSKE